METTTEYSGKRAHIEYLSHHNISVPDYGFVFDWEEMADWKFSLNDVIIVYPFTCYIIGAVYVLLVFYLQWAMKDRSPMNLRYFAFFWNVFLTFLNGFAFIRILTYMLHVLSQRGFLVSICTDRWVDPTYQNLVYIFQLHPIAVVLLGARL